MSAYETLLLAIMRADREVQDRRDRREITYASLRQRRGDGHDGRRVAFFTHTNFFVIFHAASDCHDNAFLQSYWRLTRFA